MKGDYECDQCWKAYNSEDLLQRHIRKIHVGPRWRCPDCDYSADYSDRPGLRRHLQLDHHYSKEQAMDMQFEQVKPRKRNNNNNSYSNHNHKRGRSPSPMNRSEPDRKNRSLSLSPRRSTISDASDDRHYNVRSVVGAVPNPTPAASIPYPSQVSSQIADKPEGIRAVWSGVVPKGTSITHLGVPQPVIERHFIQADDDTILVKEVFLFQAPAHWSTFKDSKFEVITPNTTTTSLNDENNKNNKPANSTATTTALNGESNESDDSKTTSLNGENSSPIDEASTSKEDKMMEDIVITVNAQENEDL